MAYFDNELEYKGLPTLKGALQNFGNKLQELLRENLAKKVKGFTSKKLEQSIQFKVSLGNGEYIFELKMEDYWKFLEEGVQGAVHQGGEYAARKSDSKFYGEPKGTAWRNKAPNSPYKFTTKPPPIDDLRAWASTTGINVYQVQRSVFIQGIKPNRFYSEIVDDGLIQELVDDLERTARESLELDLADTLKGKVK